MAAGLAVALALHALLWLWAHNVRPSLESWSAMLAARVHAELTRQEVVELDKPATPPPPSPPPPAAATRLRAATAPRAPAAAPAQAARIVTAEPRADAFVDLTAETIVTGDATVAPGGVTSRAGTNPAPGTTGPGPGGAVAQSGPPAAPDRSSVVRLEADEWQCPWPATADAQDVDQQSVVLRVIVRADGSAESARLVSDPGHGFGAAAVACALRTRFAPARTRDGGAVRAESPPIRVRFTR